MFQIHGSIFFLFNLSLGFVRDIVNGIAQKHVKTLLVVAVEQN